VSTEDSVLKAHHSAGLNRSRSRRRETCWLKASPVERTLREKPGVVAVVAVALVVLLIFSSRKK
jgi:hypothetical protein